MYAAWGLAEGEVELALDAAERMASWVLPSMPVAYLVIVLFWVRPRLPLLGYPMAAGAFEDYRNDEWLAAVFAITGIGTLVLSGHRPLGGPEPSGRRCSSCILSRVWLSFEPTSRAG